MTVVLIVLFAWIGGGVRNGVDFGLLGRCVYTDPGCSTAAATWGLVFATSGAFIAATVAAVFAAGVYDLEVAPRLGQDVCFDPAHTFSDRHFVVFANRDVSEELPPGFDDTKYFLTKLEFTNLGRLPLIGDSISGEAAFQRQQQPLPVTVNLGNIPVDRAVHLFMYFANAFGPTTVAWTPNSARQADGKKIAFHPAPKVKGRLTFELALEEPADEVSNLRAEIGDLRKLITDRLGSQPPEGPKGDETH